MGNVREIFSGKNLKIEEQEVKKDRTCWGENREDEIRLFDESLEMGMCRMCQLNGIMSGVKVENQALHQGFCRQDHFDDYHWSFGEKYGPGEQPRDKSFHGRDIEHRFRELGKKYDKIPAVLRVWCQRNSWTLDDLEGALVRMQGDVQQKGVARTQRRGSRQPLKEAA
jgi:hypothetical protein